MSVTATTRYVIRTTKGDKGPFSPAEISRLVENGRLPPTAKILDLDAKRPVTAQEAIIAAAKAGTAKLPARRSAGEATTVTLAPKNKPRPTSPAPEAAPSEAPSDEAKDDAYAPQDIEVEVPALEQAAPAAPAAAADAAEPAVHPDSETPVATRAPTPAARRAPGRDRTATATTWRGGRARASARKPRSRMRLIIVVAAVVLIALGAAGISWAMYAKVDRYPHQGDELLQAALGKPEAIAPGADAAFVKLLIRKDHAAALEATKLKRGGYEGYKPAYDEAAYRAALSAAVTKQVSDPDSALLSECAKALVESDQSVIADIAVAKKLASRAVELDQEKSWRSLDALAWATFRGGDAKKALLMEEQASELAATSGEGKTVCDESMSKFKGGGER
jgi:hypothetical protein